MNSGEIKIGNTFFSTFKSYLKQIGLSEKKILEVKEYQAQDIFVKADEADGKKDGKTDGENFLAAIKESFSSEIIDIDALSQEYLDAWSALAGEDNILDTDELALGYEEEVEDTSSPDVSNGYSGPSGPSSNKNSSDTETTGDIQDITEKSLEGKSSETLRNERSDVLSQIDTARTEMEEAKTEKQEEVTEKEENYTDTLEELAKVSKAKDEDGKTLKDLQTERNEQASKISDKESAIKDINNNINTTKDNISSIKSELDSLQEPDKSQYTTENEDGETVTDDAAYNAALAEYKAKKSDLEAKIQAEEDNLAQLELQLAQEEQALQELNNGIDTIDESIANLTIKIFEEEEANSKLAKDVIDTLIAYSKAQEELNIITQPFEEKLNTLNSNLQVYETVIAKQDAEENKEKEKWTSDVECDEAKKYQEEIDKLLVPEEIEETEETDETEETEEEDKPEPNMVLPDENQEALKTLLQDALADENVSIEDKFRLLSYAKGKSEDVIREMLQDDTFFVNAFKEIAKDDKYSTEEVIAMHQVYFDLQGDREITGKNVSNDAAINEKYLEGLVALSEKADNEGKIKELTKHFEKNGISFDTIRDSINASNLSESDKNKLLTGIRAITDKYNSLDANFVVSDRFSLGSGYNGVLITPEELIEGKDYNLLIFCCGMAQDGGQNMYKEGTTPVGTYFTQDGKEYTGKIPGDTIILQVSGPEDKQWGTKTVTDWIDKAAEEGINGVKVNINKTAVAGASKGASGAIQLARALGSDNCESLLIISATCDSLKIDDFKGMNVYATYAESGEDYVRRSFEKTIATTGETTYDNGYVRSVSMTSSGDENTKVSHHNIVNYIFSRDEDGDGFADYLQELF